MGRMAAMSVPPGTMGIIEGFVGLPGQQRSYEWLPFIDQRAVGARKRWAARLLAYAALSQVTRQSA